MNTPHQIQNSINMEEYIKDKVVIRQRSIWEG